MLAAGLRLTTRDEQPAEQPGEISLLSVAAPLSAVPIAYGLRTPGFALPVLDVERKLWADQADFFGRRLLLPIQGI